MEADQYCRELEAHLCRRNGGHLVRIVGPAFELAMAWHRMGVPLKVALQGLDRHIDRAAAKAATGARRRPMRLEFCEADVMDAFDQWRRAVGLRASALPEGVAEGVADGAEAGADTEEPSPRARVGLHTHLERTIARLTGIRVDEAERPDWSAAIDRTVRQLDAMLAPARKARGDARTAMLADLERIDAELLAAARTAAAPDLVASALAEAETDLAPFRARLSPEAWADAIARGQARALRLRLGLPAVGWEG
jgi:hypothetical protein